jgi:hypothetical protein
MARCRPSTRRAGYKRYKAGRRARGKPFFPYAMFHDTVMSLVVVCVIIAARLYLEVHGPPRCSSTTAKADPGTTSFVPRPDWYFYFLFYLLRIFKWPETVIIARSGIPTICLVLLLGLPFVTRGWSGGCPPAGRDRRRGARHPLDGRAHVEGRDGEGSAGERVLLARGSRLGPEGGSSRPTR